LNELISDTYINYLNTLAERLRGKGYTCRVFNDEIDLNSDQHIDLDSSIDITFWINQGQGAAHYAETGHKVYNMVETWSFYVLKEYRDRDIMDNLYKTVNSKNIYYNWDPRSFARTPDKWRPVEDDKMGGAYFAIWCDHPDYKTESEVWDETKLRMWASASRMWNVEVSSGESGTGQFMEYSSFVDFVEMMDGFPGYGGDPAASAVLPDPAAPAQSASWWQRLIVNIY
jgi:hypothetical protein